MEKDLDLINSVWQRVSRQEDPCSHPQTLLPRGRSNEEILRERIETGCKASAFYEVLASRARGQKAAEVFRKICGEERKKVRRLQTEYFLLNCDTYCPKKERVCVPSLLCGVRQAYMDEKDSAEGYRRGAAETDDEGLTALFLQFAEEEECHASELKNLLGSLMK